MKKLLIGFGILLLAGLVMYPVFAVGPYKGMGQGMMGSGSGNANCPWQSNQRNTNLTDEQRQKLEALDQKFFTQTNPLRNDLLVKRAQLHAELNTVKTDEAKALNLQKEINDLTAKLSQEQLKYRLEARKINPEAQWGGRGPCGGNGRMGMKGRGMMSGRSGQCPFAGGPDDDKQ